MPAALVVPLPLPLMPRAADAEELLLADPLLVPVVLPALPEEAEPVPVPVPEPALEEDGPPLSLLLRRFPPTGNGS